MSIEPFIETYTGKRFYPLNARKEDICITDIAHALSNQCRFSGHTRRFYSVAEHSVHVSLVVADRGGSFEDQLWGLLHDASEAYLVDLPTPLKKDPVFGFVYRAAERALTKAIAEAFDLEGHEPPGIVHNADLAMLATEARDLMPCKPEHWGETFIEEHAIPYDKLCLVLPEGSDAYGCTSDPSDAAASFKARFECLFHHRM
jgi:hypothetical protein